MSAINAAVGRKIGLEPSPPTSDWWMRAGKAWPDFENDLAAAWRLVEWMREQDFEGELLSRPGRGYCARFISPMKQHTIKFHENPATAICLAFCAANGIAVEQYEEVRG